MKVKPANKSEPRRILVPVDFSDPSRQGAHEENPAMHRPRTT